MNRDSVVRIVTRIRTGRPRNCDSIPDKGWEFYSSANVEIGSRAHPTSYWKGPGSKVAGACRG